MKNLIRELRRYCAENEMVSSHGIQVIIDRHDTEQEEPLAVLADRKGWWLARARHFPDRWVLNFDCETLDIWTKCEELAKPIVAPTYAAAEAAARQFLEGLEDKGGTIC